MDSFIFTIPVKLFSINSMYYRDRSIISNSAREWQRTISLYLEDDKIQEKIKQFKDYFDPQQHALKISIYGFYPKEELITKKGILSNKAFDLSNVEKPIIDLLTSKKYSTDRCKNLEIDDKNLIELHSYKGISDLEQFKDKHVTIIECSIIEHHKILKLSNFI